MTYRAIDPTDTTPQPNIGRRHGQSRWHVSFTYDTDRRPGSGRIGSSSYEATCAADAVAEVAARLRDAYPGLRVRAVFLETVKTREW